MSRRIGKSSLWFNRFLSPFSILSICRYLKLSLNLYIRTEYISDQLDQNKKKNAKILDLPLVEILMRENSLEIRHAFCYNNASLSSSYIFYNRHHFDYIFFNNLISNFFPKGQEGRVAERCSGQVEERSWKDLSTIRQAFGWGGKTRLYERASLQS